MGKRLFGFAGVAIGTFALVVACSGSSGSDITDPSGSSSGASGSSSGSSSGASSGGSSSGGGDAACAPCPTTPPSPACKGTGPCGCAPYTCPDGGTSDGGPVTPCAWAKVDPCGPGMYCDAPTCGSGTCLAIPTGAPTPVRDPVCGCDGVTYWNGTVAQASGMSWDKKGACTPGATCGGIANIKCPGKSSCNYALETKAGCNIADFGGKCWMLPPACPQIVVGVQTRGCDNDKCTDECTLIRSQQPYYRDNTCPQ